MKLDVFELAKQCGAAVNRPLAPHDFIIKSYEFREQQLQAFANAVLEEAAKKCDDFDDSEREDIKQMVAIMRQMRGALLDAQSIGWLTIQGENALAAFDKFDKGE